MRNHPTAQRAAELVAITALVTSGYSADVARSETNTNDTHEKIVEPYHSMPGENIIIQSTPLATPIEMPNLEPTPTVTPTPEPTLVVTSIPESTPKPINKPTAKPTLEPIVIPKESKFSENFYNSKDVFWQTSNACTAASAQMTLNMIYSADSGGKGFVWKATNSITTEKEILAYERAHDILLATSRGSDPAGERNALNHYGWKGSVVYRDKEYKSYSAAIKAIVKAIAKTNKPAIAFTGYGTHAIVVHGYKVSGGDPTTTDNFTVEGVYVTDPLFVDQLRNAYISTKAWSGSSVPFYARYKPYNQIDAVYKDPLDGIIGNNKWPGMYVALLPQY